MKAINDDLIMIQSIKNDDIKSIIGISSTTCSSIIKKKKERRQRQRRNYQKALASKDEYKSILPFLDFV